TSGYLFYDCQTDDARLVLTVLGEAERFGTVLANRVNVVGLLERDGRLEGVSAIDTESGDGFEVRAPNVVNATGVWADELRPQELHDEAELPRIRPSRGTRRRARAPAGAGGRPCRSIRAPCRCAAARSCRRARGARSSRCRGW